MAIDLNKLMRSETIKEVFRRKMGDASYAAFSKWLRVVKPAGTRQSNPEGLWTAAPTSYGNGLWWRTCYTASAPCSRTLPTRLIRQRRRGFGQKDAFLAYMKYGWGDYIPKALSFSPEAEAIRQEVFALSAMMRDKAGKSGLHHAGFVQS